MHCIMTVNNYIHVPATPFHWHVGLFPFNSKLFYHLHTPHHLIYLDRMCFQLWINSLDNIHMSWRWCHYHISYKTPPWTLGYKVRPAFLIILLSGHVVFRNSICMLCKYIKHFSQFYNNFLAILGYETFATWNVHVLSQCWTLYLCRKLLFVVFIILLQSYKYVNIIHIRITTTVLRPRYLNMHSLWMCVLAIFWWPE